MPEPSLMHGVRTMGKYSEVFVAFDVAKKKHAVRDRGRRADGRSPVSRRRGEQPVADRADDRRPPIDTTGCMFALKPDQRDMGFVARSRRSATNAWWSLRL